MCAIDVEDSCQYVDSAINEAEDLFELLNEDVEEQGEEILHRLKSEMEQVRHINSDLRSECECDEWYSYEDDYITEKEEKEELQNEFDDYKDEYGKDEFSNQEHIIKLQRRIEYLEARGIRGFINLLRDWRIQVRNALKFYKYPKCLTERTENFLGFGKQLSMELPYD